MDASKLVELSLWCFKHTKDELQEELCDKGFNESPEEMVEVLCDTEGFRANALRTAILTSNTVIQILAWRIANSVFTRLNYENMGQEFVCSNFLDISGREIEALMDIDFTDHLSIATHFATLSPSTRVRLLSHITPTEVLSFRDQFEYEICLECLHTMSISDYTSMFGSISFVGSKNFSIVCKLIAEKHVVAISLVKDFLHAQAMQPYLLAVIYKRVITLRDRSIIKYHGLFQTFFKRGGLSEQTVCSSRRDFVNGNILGCLRTAINSYNGRSVFMDCLYEVSTPARAPTLSPSSFGTFSVSPPIITLPASAASPYPCDCDGDVLNITSINSIQSLDNFSRDKIYGLTIMLLERLKRARVPMPPEFARLSARDDVEDRFRSMFEKSNISLESLVQDLENTRMGKLVTFMFTDDATRFSREFMVGVRDFWEKEKVAVPSGFIEYLRPTRSSYVLLARCVFNWAYKTSNPRLMTDLMRRVNNINPIVLDVDEDEEPIDTDRALAIECWQALDAAEMRWFLFESGLTDEYICDGTLVNVYNAGPLAETVGETVCNIIQEHPTFYKTIIGTGVGRIRPEEFKEAVQTDFEASLAASARATAALVSTFSSLACSSSACSKAVVAVKAPQAWECRICFQEFDNGDHQPCVFRNCGHGACRKCVDFAVNNSRVCHTCRSPLPREDAVMVNYMMMEYLQQ